LFIKVCHAVQHAHQKGLIHRDIKPSNILVLSVDGIPTPKVIDFGIAKATESRLTDHTVHSELHQFIGTPAYMSPEQADIGVIDIDTRSDIYSLGVSTNCWWAAPRSMGRRWWPRASTPCVRRSARRNQYARVHASRTCPAVVWLAPPSCPPNYVWTSTGS
jgi:serine/threonine protein kinase